jgi:hypothetical protein
MNQEKILNCPHCLFPVLIEKINCGIFRHAILKSTGQQINPHASKEECDFLIQNNLVFGCCKPFKISADQTFLEICDYI